MKEVKTTYFRDRSPYKTWLIQEVIRLQKENEKLKGQIQVKVTNVDELD
jgi:hypothetical protein